MPRSSMALFLLLLACVPAWGQSAAGTSATQNGTAPNPTASVSGTAEDQSGAVVPSAEVELVDKASGQSRKTSSDGAGRFLFNNVPLGHYLLRGNADEMRSVDQNLNLSGSVSNVTLRMTITVEEQVQVTASEDPLAADNNSDAVEITDTLIRDLPTDSQNILPLLSKFVAPGAGGTEGVSLVVDGAEADEIDDLPASAVKQVTIDRNPYAVDFRRPGKARIEITTKHGSPKRFHGQFGVYARNSIFDANDALSTQKPDLSRQLFEGTFGGPLGLPRASFFLSARHLNNAQDAIVNATVLGAGNQPVTLVQNVPTKGDHNDYLARLDFHAGKGHTLTTFYSFDEFFQSNQGVGGLNLATQAIYTSFRGHKFQFTDQAVISTKFLNTARLLVREILSRQGSLPGSFAVDVNGNFSSGPSQTARQRRETLVNFEDAATYTRGIQTFRFGAETRSRFFAVTDQTDFGGTFNFASLAQFSLSPPQPYLFTINRGDPNLDYAVYEVGGFVQDEIRLKPSLRLVAGLRYDWQSSFGNTAGLAPRAALAFSPGKRKTIVRAGFGMFNEYLPELATEQALLLDGRQVQQITITNPTYPNPFVAGITPVPSIVRIAPDLTMPYLISASVSVEHQINHRNHITVEYQHLHGVHLLRSRDVNAPLPSTGIRPDPGFFNVNQVESSASLRSNALSVSYRGRPYKRFTFIAQYTLAKVINDTSGVFSLPADNYNLRPEMGRADYDRLHRLNLAGVANLPGRFRFGTVLSVASGIPFNITTGADDNNDSVANDRPFGVTRNTGEGPGLLQLDVRATKLFRVWRPANRDRTTQNLEISLDVFNVLNHPNYPNFLGVLSSRRFGQPTTALPARTLQTSATYRF